MAIGTSTGETYPSQLESVLAALEPKESPTVPDDKAGVGRRDIEGRRDSNETDQYNPKGMRVTPGRNDEGVIDEHPGNIMTDPTKWYLRVQGPGNQLAQLNQPNVSSDASPENDLTTKLRQRFGTPPPAARIFADTVVGNTNKITEKDFTPEELDHLRAVSDKQLNLGKNVIGYGDYNPEEKGGKYEKSFERGKGGSQMFMDALTDLPSSLSFTLGMAKVKREEDGTIVINDRYHWAAPQAKVQELKDQGSWAVLKKVGEGLLSNGLLGVGNVIGNLVAPKEGGRDVEIRIPPGDASIPKNAKPNAAEFTDDKTWAAMVDSLTNPGSDVPTPDKMVKAGLTKDTYEGVVNFLDNMSNMKGAEKWSAKELIGFALSHGMNALGFGKTPTRSGPAAEAQISGKAGISEAKKPNDSLVANDNFPDTPEFSNLRMSAQEMKEYLADKAQRPDTSGMSLAEIEKMTGDWQKAAEPTAYDRALARQKAGKPTPTGDSVEDFINSSRMRREEFMADSEARRETFLGKKPNFQTIEGGRSTEGSRWSMHSEKVHNLNNAEGLEIGSAVYREHNNTWVGSRFNPETNEIIGRKSFKTLEDASAFVEGRNENPSQQPQGRPIPGEQARTQEAQRAANDRNYQLGKGTERLNVGPGKGVLNDNKEEVMAMLRKGHKPIDIARRFDITSQAVQNWIKRNGSINDISDILKD
jgi:hypothetical protein